MKRALLAMLFACSAASAQDAPHWDAVVLGKSWHFGSDTNYDYNGTNPGIGLEYRWRYGLFAGGLTYYDSFRRQAYAGYVGYQYTQQISGPWSVLAALRLGYLNGSGFHGVMALPTVGVQYKRLSVELEFIPKARQGANEIGVFARWSF